MVVLHAYHGVVLHRQPGRVFDHRERHRAVQKRRGASQPEQDRVRHQTKRIHRRILQGEISDDNVDVNRIYYVLIVFGFSR